MARRNAIRSIAPNRLGSAFPTSRRKDGESDDTGSSRDSIGGALRRRSFINTGFTATLYSQVENAEAPRKEPTLRNTCKKTTCGRASASATHFLTATQS